MQESSGELIPSSPAIPSRSTMNSCSLKPNASSPPIPTVRVNAVNNAFSSPYACILPFLSLFHKITVQFSTTLSSNSALFQVPIRKIRSPERLTLQKSTTLSANIWSFYAPLKQTLVACAAPWKRTFHACAGAALTGRKSHRSSSENSSPPTVNLSQTGACDGETSAERKGVE